MRIAVGILTGAVLLTLTACAGDDTTTTGTAPATPSTPASAAVSAAPTSTATGAATTDKELCQATDKAGKAMKAELIKAVQSGQDPTAATKEGLAKLGEELTGASAASDTKVGKAVQDLAAAAGKADEAAFDKAYAELRTSCKAEGVTLEA